MSASRTPITDWLVDLLIRGRWIGLALALVTAVVAWPKSNQLAFDQSLEALYSRDNPNLQRFLSNKATFGGDELAIVAYRDPDLMTSPAALSRVREFGERLAQVPGIRAESQQNLAQALELVDQTLKPFSRIPGLAKKINQVQQQAREMFRGILVGQDERTTAVLLRFLPEHMEPPPPPRGETVRQIRHLADTHQPPAFVVGEPVQVHDMFSYVEQDAATLGLASSVLLLSVILLLFRSIRWVILPLLVVQATLIWTRYILVSAGLQLSMVSSMLHSLVMIIAVATVTHVMFLFRSLRATLDAPSALRLTFRELLKPITLTCVTTAAGFGAQIISHTHPAQTFGYMMALASILVLVACCTILPGGVLLGQSQRTQLRPFGQALWLERPMHRLTDLVERSPMRLAVAGIVLVAISITGCFFIRVETDFTRNFRAHTPIVRSLTFVEENLGGSGIWDVSFPAPAELTPEFLDRVRELSTRLRELQLPERVGQAQRPAGQPPELALSKVLAPTDGIDLLPSLFGLNWQLRILDLLQPEFMSSMYNPDAHRMRILLRARERQASEFKLWTIAEVEKAACEVFADTAANPDKPHASGLFVLLTFLIESLLDDQWSSSILAASVLTLIMAVAYRSMTIGLISLVPNLMPILLVIGVMGWLGLPVNIGTALIASVSMGLTIDSSIHFLSGLERGIRSGLTYAEALRATHQSVGSALIFANLALIVGFLVLTLSNFVPLIYFGALVSVAMLGGLIGNLVILPLLLRPAHWGAAPSATTSSQPEVTHTVPTP